MTTPAPAVKYGERSPAWERHRRLVRREIELTGLELMAEAGYDTVTAEQIAAAAGISVRTFFRYFQTKDDVLSAMPQRVSQTMCAAVESRPPGEPILDSWRPALAGAYDAQDVRAAQLLHRIIEGQPALEHRIIGDPQLTQMLVTTIARRLGADPATDLRPSVVGVAILGALNAAFVRWTARGGDDELLGLFGQALDVLAGMSTIASS